MTWGVECVLKAEVEYRLKERDKLLPVVLRNEDEARLGGVTRDQTTFRRSKSRLMPSPRILYRPRLHVTIHRTLYSQSSYLPRLKQTMTDSVPQIRSRPDSEDSFLQQPIEKKIRLDSAGSVEPQAQPSEPTTQIRKGKNKKQKHTLPEPYSNDDVLWRDVVELLGSDIIDTATGAGKDWESPFSFKEEVELFVTSITSTGESFFPLAIFRGSRAVLVPYDAPLPIKALLIIWFIVR